MNKLLFFYVVLVLIEFFLSANGCEFHRRLEELRKKEREAKTQELRNKAIAETRAYLTAHGRVHTGDKTKLNHHHQNVNPTPKRLTKVNFQLAPIGNNMGAYNRNYYPGTSRGMKCPGTNFYCPVGRQCVYRNGRISCELPKRQTCSKGFTRVNITSTQFRCEDINECEDETLNDCEFTCQNLYGSYRCKCLPGYQMRVEGCEDINECDQAFPICQHECVNSLGSYECVCPDGYKIIGGTRCEDINECEELENACEEGTKCLNLYGGFECRQPEPCDEGYKRNGDDDFDACIIEDFKEAIGFKKPFSIHQSRYAIHSGYKAGSEVVKLRFQRSRGHFYRYQLEKGADNFLIGIRYKPTSNTVIVQTRKKLSGPAVHEVIIVIYDTDQNLYGTEASSFMSRVELSFVVSPFAF